MGYHIHDSAWGAELTPEMVAPAAISSGLADPTHVYVQRISHHADLGHGMKMVTHSTEPEARQWFLDAKNGRLVHASHGFWRGPGSHFASGGYRGAVRRAGEYISGAA
jgi:hypothetical protein